MVANSVVGMIPAGSAEPAAARSAITPVGSRVTLEVLIARNRTMALVAVPLAALSDSSSCMARMPNGVAALPRPSTLAAMLRIIAPIAGWSAGTSGNSRCISGRTSRAMITSRPPASATFISPRNRAMTPTRPMARVTEPAAPSIIAVASACIGSGWSARRSGRRSADGSRRPRTRSGRWRRRCRSRCRFPPRIVPGRSIAGAGRGSTPMGSPSPPGSLVLTDDTPGCATLMSRPDTATDQEISESCAP